MFIVDCNFIKYSTRYGGNQIKSGTSALFFTLMSQLSHKKTTCGGISPKNLPAAAEEPPRRSCFALGGCSRFFGDLALRHSAGLRLAHALRMVVVGFYYSTLPRRSFSGDGSLGFALIYPQPCSAIHPPVATNHFERSSTGGAAHSARAFCFSQNKI